MLVDFSCMSYAADHLQQPALLAPVGRGVDGIDAMA
jgi:hypothetical protein